MGTCEIRSGPSVEWYNCIAEELTYKPTPYTHTLLHLLHDSVGMKYCGVSCFTQTESQYILCTSFWILCKLQYLYKDCLAVGAALAGNGSQANTASLKAKYFPVHPWAAPQLQPPLGSCSSPEAPAWPQLPSGHWLAGAEPRWHNTSVLLRSVHSTPTYACRHLGSWIILAANREVMGCAFLWKHSLSVCACPQCGFTVSSCSLCTSGPCLSL